MKEYYLAVDIGASSGRHILGHLEKGKLILEEIHRFKNGMIKKDGHLIWDKEKLFFEIKAGMKKCREAGKIPLSMGIDTWAVDYVLIDEKGRDVSEATGYRDSRTDDTDKKVYEVIPEADLYARTGIQKQKFNTIYQLMAEKELSPERLKAADKMLLIPDYFNFRLTGEKYAEYTNASTTQLLSPEAKTWDTELIKMLGYPEKIFPKIIEPGTAIGHLSKELEEEVGFNCAVVAVATHDTASAVAAVPAAENENTLYISSGTWSLMGTELLKADCSKATAKSNFTNEGGVEYRFRFLKNIMGMWMINSAKAELDPEISFGEMCYRAAKEGISSVVDCNDDRFLAPESMSREIRKACEETGQEIPESMPQMAKVIYVSLAKCYADTAKEIEKITGLKYDKIRIIGGGCNAAFLNELTAKASGKDVYAGPVEGTAIGNIAVQMIASGVFKDLKDARKCIAASFEIKVYDHDKLQ